MTMKENTVKLWVDIAHKLLASVFVDHASVFPIMDVVGGDSELFPPKEAKIWRAVLECLNVDTPPTVEAVAVRLHKAAIEKDYLDGIAACFTANDNKRAPYLATELKRLGVLSKVNKIGQELSDADNPENVEKYLNSAQLGIQGVSALQSNRTADAKAVSDSAWNELENYDETAIPSIMDWFNKLSGGYWPGMITWIAAAYKQGKSTLMRNEVLHTLENGFAVDVFAAEGTREMFALDCQAMIATKIMIEQFNIPVADCRLGGLFIKRQWRINQSKPVLKKHEYEALLLARKIWDGYNVRVWDSRDGIKDLVTLRYRIKESKMKYGSKCHWLDYAGLFGDNGLTTYEQAKQSALVFQDIASSEQVAMNVLAQRNESSIKSDGGYSVGVKGGGDASATADFLFVPSIDPDTKMFNIKLKYSRHTATGDYDHFTEPNSGLFTDKYYTIKTHPLDY